MSMDMSEVMAKAYALAKSQLNNYKAAKVTRIAKPHISCYRDNWYCVSDSIPGLIGRGKRLMSHIVCGSGSGK